MDGEFVVASSCTSNDAIHCTHMWHLSCSHLGSWNKDFSLHQSLFALKGQCHEKTRSSTLYVLGNLINDPRTGFHCFFLTGRIFVYMFDWPGWKSGKYIVWYSKSAKGWIEIYSGLNRLSPGPVKYLYKYPSLSHSFYSVLFHRLPRTKDKFCMRSAC